MAMVLASAMAGAQVHQPDGTVIPTPTSTDGPSVGDILGMRGETNLTPPLTPFDAQANAHPDPQTFRPGCRISFHVIGRYAGDHDAFGWYNVLASRPAAPPIPERYILVPSAAMMDPPAVGGVGYTATLDIGTDPRYLGGDIGFFLHNTTEDTWTYTEQRYQPSTVPGFIYALIYDSRVTSNAFYFVWEDLITDNDNDFNDLMVLVDNLTCSGGGGPCMVPGAQGACANGTMQCRNATLTCVSTVTPTPEVCDGVDNNCNGLTDDGTGLCPAQQVCDRGTCVDRCEAELGCLTGFVCSDRGTCVERACATVTCATGSVCHGGVCRALCDGVMCPHGQICRDDQCVDPCVGLTCDADQVCTDGVCQTRCPCRRCDTGQMCFTDGRCRPADCATVTCGAGMYCEHGHCQDACAGAVCPGGARCVAGRCLPPVTGDAGAGGTDGAVTGDGAVTADGGGTGSTDAAVGMDGGGNDGGGGSMVIDNGAGSGCGCRAGTEGSHGGVGMAVGMLLAAGVRRRRRNGRTEG